jgi:hypothetical protein
MQLIIFSADFYLSEMQNKTIEVLIAGFIRPASSEIRELHTLRIAGFLDFAHSTNSK